MRLHRIAVLLGLGLLLLIPLFGSAAQGGVRIVVVNEFLNVRTIPAIGAPVIDTVEAGYVFDIVTGRSADGEWVRVDFECNEGWINLTPTLTIEGDINALPVRDPRTIPAGGFESPRAGFSQQTGPIEGYATDGLRLRAGPSTAYPTIGNVNFNQRFSITGRNRCGNWLQVNFENTLGWVAARFVQPIGGDIRTLPEGGVVAQEPPISGEGIETYVATLRLMRDRLDIAQTSLNEIRTVWTDAALSGRVYCPAYPAQPSDFFIPTPVLAANYITLQPLQVEFNDAMANIRLPIDLLIQLCNLPGTGSPVGSATIQGALNAINLAEEQIVSLRIRLEELIPDLEAGGDECLLVYNNKAEILPRISIGTIYLDEFTQRLTARGYCFEGLQSQVLNIQALPIPPSEQSLFVSISTLDDPANFINVSRASPGQLLRLGPVTLPRTTTYVVLIADLAEEGRSPVGEFAFLLRDAQFIGDTEFLTFDEQLQTVLLTTDISTQATLLAPTDRADVATCPSTQFTCAQLQDCQEAIACLQAGNFSLDPDGDGTPCEDLLCGGTENVP
jgi:uncharacterized protein YraI